MQVLEWITKTSHALKSHSATPRLDAEVLLCDALGTTKAWLYAHPEDPLQGATLQRLRVVVGRRKTGEPIAYIRGKSEFYGREFMVNPNVLIPRPESEAIIELGKAYCKNLDQPRIADVGSGSGALGISLVLEIPNAVVDFYDISRSALDVARTNSTNHSVGGRYYESDLMSEDRGPYDIVLANLPYVPDDYIINIAAKHEPALALFGGTDGLDLYRQLYQQIKETVWSPSYVLTESLLFQHDSLEQIAKNYGFRLTDSRGLIQAFEPMT